jgi:hypothetical protein
LRRCSGGQFDPHVVDVLLSILETDEALRAMLPPDAEYLSSGSPAAPRVMPTPAHLGTALKRPR